MINVFNNNIKCSEGRQFNVRGFLNLAIVVGLAVIKLSVRQILRDQVCCSLSSTYHNGCQMNDKTLFINGQR